MRTRWILSACVWLLACSSSKDTESDGAAGRSGSAVSSTNGAGAAAPGGSRPTGSSSNASSGTGTSTATASGGVTPGGTGACPAQAPSENVTCTPVDLTCGYETQQCTCEAEGLFATWNCRRASQVCPDAVPENGSACTSGRGECMIAGQICTCSEDTSALPLTAYTWSCWNPANCPAAAPAEQEACDAVGMECPYESTLEELDCECTATGWDCGRQACPASVPAVGEACEGGDGVCTFGAQTCDCQRRAWVCWDPATCPAAPAHAAACTIEGMLCPYTGGECECEDAAWSCDSELRPGGDTDAGI
jgi:hypothetical protein